MSCLLGGANMGIIIDNANSFLEKKVKTKGLQHVEA